MQRKALILILVLMLCGAVRAQQLLKQSTAATVKLGPFVDSTDGVTAETGLTISQADIRLSKNGGAFAQTHDATGATHDENGYYGVPLDATDTGTLGRLRVSVTESGALPVWQDFMVVPANVYDSIVGGSDYLQADAVQIEGSDATDTLGTAQTGDTYAALPSNFSSLGIEADGDLTKVNTLDGHTAQTGDSYARLGAPVGASVSADVAAVKSETASILEDTGTTLPATLATIDGIVDDILVDTGTTLNNLVDDLESRLTAARAGYLDKLNVSGTLAHSDAAATYKATGFATSAALTTVEGKIDTIGGYVDTEIAAILADTGELQTNQGNWLTATGFSTHSAADVWTLNISAYSGVGYAGTYVKSVFDKLPTNYIMGSSDWTDQDDELAAIYDDTDNSLPTYLSTLTDRLTASRAGYLDKLNVTGTLAHSDAAATYKADVSALATSAALTTVGGYVDTEVAAIKVVTDKLADTMELDGAVYRFTTNALEQAPSGGGGGGDATAANQATIIAALTTAQADLDNPSQYKADVSALATSAALTTVGGYVDTEVAAIKVVTDKLADTMEDDGGTYRFTTNALEQAPSGSGGDATAANQTTIINHLTDVKGGTFSGTTDSLEAIRNRGDAEWITATGFSTLALDDFFDTDSGTDYASAVAGSVVKEIVDNGAGGLALSTEVDGTVTLDDVLEMWLAFMGGKLTVTDNGATSTISYYKQDGSTIKYTITANDRTGVRTTTGSIDP